MDKSIYINEIIRLSIGMVLVLAAYSKTKEFREFKDTLVTSFGVNQSLSRYIAPAVIAAEWLSGFVLLVNIHAVDRAMFTALVMFSMFTTLVSFLLYRDGVVKCNCFGEQERPVSIFDMIRNTICIVAIVFYLNTGKSAAPLSYENTFLLFGIALPITLIFVNFHEVISIFRKSI